MVESCYFQCSCPVTVSPSEWGPAFFCLLSFLIHVFLQEIHVFNFIQRIEGREEQQMGTLRVTTSAPGSLCLAARQPRCRSPSHPGRWLCTAVLCIHRCLWMGGSASSQEVPSDSAVSVLVMLFFTHVKAIIAASCVTPGLGHQPSCAGTNELHLLLKFVQCSWGRRGPGQLFCWHRFDRCSNKTVCLVLFFFHFYFFLSLVWGDFWGENRYTFCCLCLKQGS